MAFFKPTQERKIFISIIKSKFKSYPLHKKKLSLLESECSRLKRKLTDINSNDILNKHDNIWSLEEMNKISALEKQIKFTGILLYEVDRLLDLCGNDKQLIESYFFQPNKLSEYYYSESNIRNQVDIVCNAIFNKIDRNYEKKI